MKFSRTVVLVLVSAALFTTFTAPALAGEGIWKNTQCAAGTPGPNGPCNFCDALWVAKNIVAYLLQFATLAAVIMIVVGALTMMFAAGSEEKFATGKRTILNAVIGLAIALASWLIINTVIQFLAPGKTNVPWAQISCG